MTEPRKPRTRAIPWWGRLEVRVIAALVLLGTLCVGASAYVVQLAVAYFDTRVTEALSRGEEVAESIEPFHSELIEAHKSAFEARGRAMALEIALEDARGAELTDGDRLQALLEREKDVVQLVLQRRGGDPIERNREEVFPEQDFEVYDVVADLRPASTGGSDQLKVFFAIDPEIDVRYQALGERKREIGLARSTQPEIEDAVIDVVGGASAVVLTFALLLGFIVARTMTRKVSELSRVMTRVGHGDLSVRARRLGRDELGQLAHAFNHMLDELQVAQEKLAYLQRIGAWQEMARRIAHEIKNPLTPIQLAVQQLKEKDPGLSPEFSNLLRTSAEIVEDEIDGLKRMVVSFSQFAKVPEVRLASVQLERVLDEFERAYGHLTEEGEEDRLAVEVPDMPLSIMGDRQLLKQALVNLVENAVLSAREAKRDPVRVEVVGDRSGADAVITIDDNGPGIDADRRQQVFEPYETSREQGTGLGLAIVKKIVLDHGGEIWVEDSALGGARFVIRLPAVDEPG